MTPSEVKLEDRISLIARLCEILKNRWDGRDGQGEPETVTASCATCVLGLFPSILEGKRTTLVITNHTQILRIVKKVDINTWNALQMYLSEKKP